MGDYETIDSIMVRIPDCFVKYNKTGRGSGEARLYVGGVTIRNWSAFFEDFKLRCFFDKTGLSDYLQSVEFEYKNPSQGYIGDIKDSWQVYCQELEHFPETIYFNIFPNNDTNNKRGASRFYIKSHDVIYDFFRRVALPNMTSLLIQKIRKNNENVLWFRVFLNDVGGEIDRQIADEDIERIHKDKSINETEKERIIKARMGQGYFRELIVAKYKRCIITGVDDERVLVASHIKPWVSSNNSERIHRENGLLLSPTYDKLFDKGFISFRDTGVIMLSHHFSEDNFRRLGLSQGKKYNLRVADAMKPFLEFHRDTIFIK